MTLEEHVQKTLGELASLKASVERSRQALYEGFKAAGYNQGEARAEAEKQLRGRFHQTLSRIDYLRGEFVGLSLAVALKNA